MPRKPKAQPKAKPNWPPKLDLDPYGDGAPVVIRGVDFMPLDPVEELPRPGGWDDEEQERRHRRP